MDENKNKVEESNLRLGLDASSLPAERMMKFFTYDHLPGQLQEISKKFCDVAAWLVLTQPQTPERTICLRKLLEAKDCAVRNAL